MLREREVRCLADVCVYLNRGAAPAYVERGGVLVMNQKCIRSGRVSDDEARRTDPQRKPVLPDRMLQRWDVLVNSTGMGTLGRVGQITALKEAATVDSHVTIVRPDPAKVNPAYLGFVLRHLEPEIEALGEGSTGQTELSRGRLASLRVLLPPLGEQAAIASVLTALDEKMEVNRSMARTLLDMAQTAFRSWFVDFIGHSRLTPSDIGPIPSGWRADRLEDHVDVVKGLSYKGEFLREAGRGIPMVNLNSILEGGGWKEGGLKYYDGPYKPRHAVVPGDIVVANTEQGHDYLLIGCPAMVPKRVGENAIFTHHIYRVRPAVRSPISGIFLYLLLLRPQFRQVVTSYTNGTTVNGLFSDGLLRPRFACPPAAVVAQFSEIIGPLLDRAESCVDESASLEALRGFLLPKLIAGEVSAADASTSVPL